MNRTDDPYFARRFVGLSSSVEEFRAAIDVFGDVMLKDQSVQNAVSELSIIEGILDGDGSGKVKCQAMWRLIKGTASGASASATVPISRVP